MRTGLLFLILLGCHSPLVVVERMSSGAVERAFEFSPTPGPDGHYIPFPAHPFVNCLDVLRLQSTDPNKRSIGRTPCADSFQYRDFAGYVDDRVSWAGASEADQLAALETRITKEFDNAQATQWPAPVLSFMHFSDAQIREPDAKLGGSGVSRRLDGLVQSFERDYDQEQYSMFVYAAVVETVNRELCLYDPSCRRGRAPDARQRIAPTVMIHTGDAVDAGLESEFVNFVEISNRLQLPWYQAIGNHDVLAFGNLRLTSWNSARNKVGEDACQGAEWKGIDCTCTRVAAMVREYNIPKPDNRGVLHTQVPAKWMTLVPILLKRICIAHAVAGDRFVMDPKRPELGLAGGGHSVNSFIAAHCEGEFPDCKSPRNAAKQYAVNLNGVSNQKESYRCATLPRDGTEKGLQSRMHGFDLAPGFRTPMRDFDERLVGEQDKVPTEKLANKTFISEPNARPGYYCFEVASADPNRRAWAIVLDTSTNTGAYGAFSRGQGDWLENLLFAHGQESPDFAWRIATKKASRWSTSPQIGANDLVMLFAHHPVWNVYEKAERDRLQYIVTHSRNVVAYFTGHTHESELRVIHPPDSKTMRWPGGYVQPPPKPVWEVTAPSTLGYPQQARQVTIKSIGNLGYLDVLSFSPSGTGDSAAKIQLAMEGAKRDKCQDKSPSCPNGRPRLPGREVTFPRLWFRLP